MRDEAVWLTVEDVARAAGMTPKWVREQIHARRLVATVWMTGERRTYRISEQDWHAFQRGYSQRTSDPGWE